MNAGNTSTSSPSSSGHNTTGPEFPLLKLQSPSPSPSSIPSCQPTSQSSSHPSNQSLSQPSTTHPYDEPSRNESGATNTTNSITVLIHPTMQPSMKPTLSSKSSSSPSSSDFIRIYQNSTSDTKTSSVNDTVEGGLVGTFLIELEDLGLYDAEIWNDKFRNIYFLALLLTFYIIWLCCRLTCAYFSCCNNGDSEFRNYRTLNTDDDLECDDDGIELQDTMMFSGNNAPDEERAFGVLEMDDEN